MYMIPYMHACSYMVPYMMYIVTGTAIVTEYIHDDDCEDDDPVAFTTQPQRPHLLAQLRTTTQPHARHIFATSHNYRWFPTQLPTSRLLDAPLACHKRSRY